MKPGDKMTIEFDGDDIKATYFGGSCKCDVVHERYIGLAARCIGESGPSILQEMLNHRMFGNDKVKKVP
jgi:hypothetical protein